MTPLLYVAPNFVRKRKRSQDLMSTHLYSWFDFRLPLTRLGKVKASFTLLSQLLKLSQTFYRHDEHWACMFLFYLCTHTCAILCKYTNFRAKTGGNVRISLFKWQYSSKFWEFGGLEMAKWSAKSPQLTAVRSDEGL